MKVFSKWYLIIIFIIILILEIFIFTRFLYNDLKVSSKMASTFLTNLMNSEFFVVTKLDEHFYDSNLGQDFSKILKEGPNEYLEGIYYSVKSLKYVKKVEDGYLLYEIPETVLNMPQKSGKIYMVVYNNKIVYSNEKTLIGSALNKKGFLTESSDTIFGYKVIVMLELSRFFMYILLFFTPIILIFVLLMYIILHNQRYYNNLLISVETLSESLKQVYNDIKNGKEINFCTYEMKNVEMKKLQLILYDIIQEIKDVYKEYAKTIEDLDLKMMELEEINKALMERDIQLISVLAEAVEIKDSATGNHSKKVAEIALKIAEELGVKDSEELEAIKYGAILHDIGKIGIPESILNKPGKLTPEEFELMKKHTIFGEKIISTIPGWNLVADIIRHHHENWDGSGYPDGLKNGEISLRAQIVSISDVFIALIEDRPYRKAMTIDEALDVIKSMVNKKFSEKIYNAFLRAFHKLNDFVD